MRVSRALALVCACVALSAQGDSVVTYDIALQGATPGTVQTGNGNISGTFTATTFTGANANGSFFVDVESTGGFMYVGRAGTTKRGGFFLTDDLLAATPEWFIGFNGSTDDLLITAKGGSYGTSNQAMIITQAATPIVQIAATLDTQAAVTMKIGNANAQAINIAPQTSIQEYGRAFLKGTWSMINFGAAVNGQNFTGGFRQTSAVGRFNNVTCGWATAGTGGTTGYVVTIRNVTDSTDLCTVTIGACTGAANTPVTAASPCATTSTSGKNYAIKTATTSDCATYPSNVVCTIEIISPAATY